MKEYEARVSILKRTDLTNADKVVMMAILMTMDWKTWKNRTSHAALARLTGRNRGNINKNVKKLENLGIIKRDWYSSANRCKSPVMSIQKDQSHINPWGVPSAHLWGDELREQNERVLRERKEADK